MSTHSSFNHANKGNDHSVIRKIVAEHGLANAHSHHSPDGETHTVTTHHEDGHTHQSDGHPDMNDVIEHIVQAHGGY